MQRTWIDRLKKISYYVIPIILLAVLIILDQRSKVYFKDLYKKDGVTVFIGGLISFTYTVNTGAAWSFLAGVSWAQTFFKILTVVALLTFIVLYVYALKKRYVWLKYTIILIVGGTIGNFIDRLLFGGVTDFILLTFIDFPVFNLADCYLTIGVIMFVVHYLFIDEDAIFNKTAVKKETENDIEALTIGENVKENNNDGEVNGK